MSTIAERGSRMRYYDSDSYSFMQMRHFRSKLAPKEESRASIYQRLRCAKSPWSAMRESIEQEQLSRPSCRQALNAVCHQRSSPLRNARCRRYAHTEHCYAYGCCVCSVCCSTLSSTQQAIGPICAGRYALDRGRFGRSNASLRCPVTAACPEIRQGARRLACKRACVCECARG